MSEAKQSDSADLFGGTGAEAMDRGAYISPCGRYRYSLWRQWTPGPMVMFVGLNPSTADTTLDDPTIRRCIGFARAWGYCGLMMTNLFAWRSTDPRGMLEADDPTGPDNNRVLLNAHAKAAVTIAAWGVHGTHGGRHNAVRDMLPRLHYLRLTKDGHPGHPLYLPASLQPMEWVPPNVGRNRRPMNGAAQLRDDFGRPR
jgi:hypothetical protein